MMHWLVVGHFDALDLIDRSEKPYRPKPMRPISREAAKRAEVEYGTDIGEYLGYADGGCVYCNWSLARHDLWDRVRDFACFLAEREGAVVLDENFLAWWPPAVSRLQRQAWGWGTDAEPGAAPNPAA
jgi:hypothetical protein